MGLFIQADGPNAQQMMPTNSAPPFLLSRALPVAEEQAPSWKWHPSSLLAYPTPSSKCLRIEPVQRLSALHELQGFLETHLKLVSI